MMQLDRAPHRAEQELKAEIIKAAMKVGIDKGVIDDALTLARAAGLPWGTIIALMIQYGPQFLALLKQIMDALNTPAPGQFPQA